MGHIRLGDLPRTRRWKQVVALVAGGADAAQVANASVRATEQLLHKAFNDEGLVETLWLFLHIPRFARSIRFVADLKGQGLDVSDGSKLMEILAAFTEAVDERLAEQRSRTDLGEMAQMAAVETFAEVVGPEAGGLFDCGPDDIRLAFSRFATIKKVSYLGRRFFARLIFRLLDFNLSRFLSDHVGDGRRFSSLKEVADFYEALRTHCEEAARVVEVFSGDWFSKENWETRGNVTRERVRSLAHGAMAKLVDELERRNPVDA